MRVTLADVEADGVSLNKDLAGGFGTSSRFGRSPLLRLMSYLKRGKINIPLISLGYLAAILKGRGYDVRLSHGELLSGTDVYIVYSSLVGHESEMAFARRARQQGARVGFVGSMATALPELFAKHADFVVTGEPEAAMGMADISCIRGVTGSAFIEDLDTLPFPDWRDFNWKDFTYSIYLKDKPIFPVLSSRGCSHPCEHYCPYPLAQGSFRARSPESVIGELEYLVRDYGARGVVFRDPNFALDGGRTQAIAEGIIRAGLGVQWACETRPSHLGPEQLEIMKKSGLTGVNVGIESSSPKVLEKYGRDAFPEDNLFEFVSQCRRLGIRVGAFYTLGLPEDTTESIEDTIRFAKRLNTDYAQFTIATPYPGTPFYENVKDRISLSRWEDFDGYTPVFRHPSLEKEELSRLKESAFRSYYLRPSWLLRYLGARCCS